MISKWKYNYTDEEKGMALTIQSLKQEIGKLVDELEEQEQHIKEANFEIERLNKKIEQYENPEDMTLMFMWCDEKAKDEIKRLKNDIKRITNICNEKIKIINEVREYIENKLWNYFDERNSYLKVRDGFLEILDKENK